MKKRKNKILLVGDNSKEESINNLKKNSRIYTWENLISRPNEILCRVENEKVFVVIPWSLEKKEFRGIIYEKEMQTYIEGAFYPLKMYLYHTLFFWGLFFVTIIVALSWLKWDLSWMLSAEFLWMIWVGVLVLCLFFLPGIWMLFGRSKKYEGKIVSFLIKSLQLK